MKRTSLILFVSFCLTTLSGCVKNEDNETLNIPSSCTIYYGDKYQLNSYQEWKSSKPFIATVDGSGTIVANHAGGCTVSCSKGSCTVNVIPTKTLYNEPLCESNLTSNKITNKFGTPDYWSDDYMVYKTGLSSTPFIYYAFESSGSHRFKGASVVVKKTLLNDLCEHLNQRYARQDGSYYIWADEYVNNANEITKYVGICEDGGVGGGAMIPLIGPNNTSMWYTEYYRVTYEPAND